MIRLPSPAALLTVLCLPLVGCGPTILEKRMIEKPDPALLRPGPSPEEERGEVPALTDIRPKLTLVPADHEAPQPPDDPRPLALRDAPATAPPLPPPPAAPARGPEGERGRDDRRDGRRDDRGGDEVGEGDVDGDDPGAEDEDDVNRRGGIRVNPR